MVKMSIGTVLEIAIGNSKTDCIIAQVAPKRCMLIALEDGNRLFDETFECDVLGITESEIRKYIDDFAYDPNVIRIVRIKKLVQI